MRRVAVFVMAVVLWAGAVPAQAHTEAELESWLEGHDRLEGTLQATLSLRDQARVDLTMVLERILEDMVRRHPCSKVLETWTDERCLRPDPPRHSDSGQVSRSGSSGMGSNVEQWRSLVSAYFPASEVERALCIMGHESGGNPGAKNPRSSAAGLFQFLQSTWDRIVPSGVTGGSYASGRVYDPSANTAAAAWLVAADGWHHWSPWNRGLCR